MFERRFSDGERHSDRKPKQHRDQAWFRKRRQPGVRDRLGQTDVEVESEGRGDFVLKELSQAAMLRIDPAQQFAFVVAEGDRVIGLPRARLPGRFLASQDDRQAIEICDHAPVHRLIEGEQARLVSQELADGDGLFSLLGKLRPVLADALLVVEPAPGMGDRQSHRSQALGCRVDQDHGVLFPRLTGRLVPHTAPQVNDLLASVVHATGAAQFVSPRKILSERVSHGIKARAHMAFNTDLDVSLHERSRLAGAAWHIKLGYAVIWARPCA